jgi:uncharacterized protein (DUF2147 family)
MDLVWTWSQGQSNEVRTIPGPGGIHSPGKASATSFCVFSFQLKKSPVKPLLVLYLQQPNKQPYMKVIASILLLFLVPLSLAAQPKADDIVGHWIASENKVKVEIYRSGNKYYGKVTWLKEPLKDGKPKVDHKNPNAKLRNKPVIGLVVLRDFVFDDDEWTSGEVYDPSSGKEYDCYITMPDKNTLKVRGYIGFSIFGRTTIWKRA